MPLFAKKVKIYEDKGKKAEWKSVRAALKEAGIAGVSTGIWQDEPPVGGCGAHLDGRDFGPNGRIDRDIYVIRVPEDEEEKASTVMKNLLPDYKPYKRDENRFKLT